MCNQTRKLQFQERQNTQTVPCKVVFIANVSCSVVQLTDAQLTICTFGK